MLLRTPTAFTRQLCTNLSNDAVLDNIAEFEIHNTLITGRVSSWLY